MITTAFVFFVFVFIELGTCAPSLQRTSQQILSSNIDSSKERTPREQEYAVGFELTPSYGTASIRWADGSFSDIIKIPGSASYKKSMYRYSLDSSRHLHPPYAHIYNRILDLPRVLLRKYRMYRGQPATEQVGDIADMIARLRVEVHSYWALRFPEWVSIDKAVITRPLLNALYEEDIVDAVKHVGMQYVKLCKSCTAPLAPWSAYVGAGFGLCEHYSDTQRCRDEMKALGSNNTVTFFWAEEYLQLASYPLTAYLTLPKTSPRYDSIRYDLGQNQRVNGSYREGFEERFFQYIRANLRKASTKCNPIEIVILQGEGLADRSDARAVAFMMDIATKEVQEERVGIWWEGPVFEGARGAAEWMFRWKAGYGR